MFQANTTAAKVQGQRFGRLRVIQREANIGTLSAWLCECDCGNSKVVAGTMLLRGVVKSCGCLRRKKRPEQAEKQKTHDMSNTPTYRSWMSMRRRCSDPGATGFHRYGGRGITVSDRWQSFEMFLEDMGERPAGTTLDRIDNSRGYEPGNCRWASKIQQCRNTDRNLYIEKDGERRCLVEWCELLGVPYHRTLTRIKRGMEPVVALTTPALIAPRKTTKTTGAKNEQQPANHP